MTTQKESTIVLSEDNVRKASSLKDTLNYRSENAAISESLDITQEVVRVVQNGGKVILRESNGKSNQYVMKT